MKPNREGNPSERQRKNAEKQGKRKLVSSAIAMVFSLGLLIFATTSFGWFSNNKQVESKGMSLKADVPPNLIIAKSADVLSSLRMSDFGTDGDTPFRVVFTDGGRSRMDAATRDSSVSGTALKYVSNTEIIKLRTGLPDTDGTLVWKPVEESTTSSFYVDYMVYIASYGAPLTDVKLVAHLEPHLETDETLPQTHKAASVDFYVTSVSTDNYRGTLNLAGINPDGTANTEVPLTDKIDVLTPDDGNTCVIMRCYFDGALIDPSETDAPTAFINSYSVNTDQLELGIYIEAVDCD